MLAPGSSSSHRNQRRGRDCGGKRCPARLLTAPGPAARGALGRPGSRAGRDVRKIIFLRGKETNEQKTANNNKHLTTLRGEKNINKRAWRQQKAGVLLPTLPRTASRAPPPRARRQAPRGGRADSSAPPELALPAPPSTPPAASRGRGRPAGRAGARRSRPPVCTCCAPLRPGGCCCRRLLRLPRRRRQPHNMAAEAGAAREGKGEGAGAGGHGLRASLGAGSAPRVVCEEFPWRSAATSRGAGGQPRARGHQYWGCEEPECRVTFP